MANAEHLKILAQGVNVWNRWRKDYPNLNPGLRNAELGGQDLRQIDLRRSNLRHADLRGARLDAADLTGSRLNGANLNRASLREATLDGANLVRATLVRAELDGASLRRCDLYLADLSQAVLKDADLMSAVLNKAVGHEANLVGASLRNAMLSQADFDGADLSGANLKGANLNRVRLRKTNSRTADFTGANLVWSKFQGAALQGSVLALANLAWADFHDANFDGASLRETVFAGTRLEAAAGLDRCIHLGPSIVDMRTVRLSWPLPHAFLRGTGFDDGIIKFFPELIAQASTFGSCFISYSHADKLFARRLHDHLQSRGIRCWLDEHDMKPGDRILDVVNDAIRLHDKILLCCSETSLNSWWVKDEIQKALDREREEESDIILPLNLDGYLLDGWDSGQTSTIRARLAADFAGWEHDDVKFEEQLEKVVNALRNPDRAKATLRE